MTSNSMDTKKTHKRKPSTASANEAEMDDNVDEPTARANEAEMATMRRRVEILENTIASLIELTTRMEILENTTDTIASLIKSMPAVDPTPQRSAPERLEDEDEEQPSIVTADRKGSGKCCGLIGRWISDRTPQDMIGESIWVFLLSKNPDIIFLALGVITMQCVILGLVFSNSPSVEYEPVCSTEGELICEYILEEDFVVVLPMMALLTWTLKDVMTGLQLLASVFCSSAFPTSGTRNMVSQIQVFLLGAISIGLGLTTYIAALFLTWMQGTNNLDFIVNFAGILFIMDMDEAAFVSSSKIAPHWHARTLDSIKKEFTTGLNGKEIPPTQDQNQTSTFSSGSAALDTTRTTHVKSFVMPFVAFVAFLMSCIASVTCEFLGLDDGNKWRDPPTNVDAIGMSCFYITSGNDLEYTKYSNEYSNYDSDFETAQSLGRLGLVMGCCIFCSFFISLCIPFPAIAYYVTGLGSLTIAVFECVAYILIKSTQFCNSLDFSCSNSYGARACIASICLWMIVSLVSCALGNEKRVTMKAKKTIDANVKDDNGCVENET